MNKKPKTNLRDNQEGVVAIVVAVIMIMILSLIVLAMSQNTRREQRQTLDRQLSDQAFYNAESGINDVTHYLYTKSADETEIENKECDGLFDELDNEIDEGGTNKYTCLLYDRAPETLEYEGLSISNPEIVPINTVNGDGDPVNIANLTISWDDEDDREASFSDGCNFAGGALPQNCNYGGVRAELIAPSQNREVLRQRSVIAFLLPHVSGDAPIAVAGQAYPNSQGIFSRANCPDAEDDKRRCSKTFTNINQNNFYLTLRSLYRPVNLKISGVDADGNTLRFEDAQIIVDSTGKASDILRRVQVRIPAQSQYYYPGFALQTKESICKRLTVSREENGTGSVAPQNSNICPLYINN